MATALGWTAEKIFSTAARGLRYPTITGTGIGAAYGFLSADDQSFTNRLEAALKGGLAGAAIGAGISAAPGVAERLWKRKSNIGKFLREKGEAGIKLGWNVGKLGGRAINFALAHPVLVGGGAAALYAQSTLEDQYGQGGVSPTLEGLAVNTNYRQQAAKSEQLRSMYVSAPMIGNAPEFFQAQAQQVQQQREIGFMEQQARNYADRRLQFSTMGLVGGLHSSRHG